MKSPDIRIESHFSLFLVWPLSARAISWLRENVNRECQRFGSALVVEPRYVNDIISGMTDDGLLLTRRAAR